MGLFDQLKAQATVSNQSIKGESVEASKARFNKEYPSGSLTSGGGGATGLTTHSTSSPPPSTPEPQVVTAEKPVNWWQDVYGRVHQGAPIPGQAVYIGTSLGQVTTTYSYERVPSTPLGPSVSGPQVSYPDSPEVQEASARAKMSFGEGARNFFSAPFYQSTKGFDDYTTTTATSVSNLQLLEAFNENVATTPATKTIYGLFTGPFYAGVKIADILGFRGSVTEPDFSPQAIRKVGRFALVDVPAGFVMPGIEFNEAIKQGNAMEVVGLGVGIVGGLALGHYAGKIITPSKVTGYEYSKVKGANVGTFFEAKAGGLYAIQKVEPILDEAIKVKKLSEIPKTVSGSVEGTFIKGEKTTGFNVFQTKELIGFKQKAVSFGKFEGELGKAIPERSSISYEIGEESPIARFTKVIPEASKTETFMPKSSGALTLSSSTTMKEFTAMGVNPKGISNILEGKSVFKEGVYRSDITLQFSKPLYFGESKSSYSASMGRSQLIKIENVPYDLNHNEIGNADLIFGKEKRLPRKAMRPGKPLVYDTGNVKQSSLDYDRFSKAFDEFMRQHTRKRTSISIEQIKGTNRLMKIKLETGSAARSLVSSVEVKNTFEPKEATSLTVVSIPEAALKTEVKPIISYDYRLYDQPISVAAATGLRQTQGIKTKPAYSTDVRPIRASDFERRRIIDYKPRSEQGQRAISGTESKQGLVQLPKFDFSLKQVQAQAQRTIQATMAGQQTRQLLKTRTEMPGPRMETTITKIPVLFKLPKAGSLKSLIRSTKSSKKKAKKGFKLLELTPLADYFSKTLTEARTGRPASNVPITPKWKASFSKMLRTGGQRFPTAEMVKRKRWF